jgi:hypothetical protein
MNSRPVKELFRVRGGGTIEFLCYDDGPIQFWRITFTKDARHGVIRLQIPLELIARTARENLLAFTEGKATALALVIRLYTLALEGNLPIVFSGFDDPMKCDKNIG